MKKFIQIFSLIIFIIFALGITTSNAVLTVTTTTTAEDLKNNLYQGLTITTSVMRNNPYIFCREHGRELDSATYYQDGDEIEYKNNAIAYIISANRNRYTKREIQEAYWKELGQSINLTTNSKKLFDIANAYQTYKEKEIPATQGNSTPTLSVNGNEAIYGPIVINYSYAYAQGEHFGGFNYKFIGNNNENTNVNDSVTLLYQNEAIGSSQDGDGYKQVRSAEYNDKELYVKIDLSDLQSQNISNINMKIQYNTLNIEATVYQIKGNYSQQITKTIQCTANNCNVPNCTCKDYTGGIVNFSTGATSFNAITKYRYNGTTYKYVNSFSGYNNQGTYMKYRFYSRKRDNRSNR